MKTVYGQLKEGSVTPRPGEGIKCRILTREGQQDILFPCEPRGFDLLWRHLEAQSDRGARGLFTLHDSDYHLKEVESVGAKRSVFSISAIREGDRPYAILDASPDGEDASCLHRARLDGPFGEMVREAGTGAKVEMSFGHDTDTNRGRRIGVLVPADQIDPAVRAEHRIVELPLNHPARKPLERPAAFDFSEMDKILAGPAPAGAR